jgi:hypothetical protein
MTVASDDATQTYRALRIMMVTVLLILAVSILKEWRSTATACWQTSISAYYYTPVQAVFVGTLVTLGICMISLKGSGRAEDIILNVAGLLAPLVAVVPTPDPGTCDSVPINRGTIADNVANNVTALLVVGFLTTAFAVALVCSSRTRRTTRAQVIALGAAAAVLVGGSLWFDIARTSFIRHAHDVAAVSLFACIVIVVLLNGRDQRRMAGRGGYALRYLTIALAMLGAAAVLLGIRFATDWVYWRLLLESILIVLFAVFWGIQTRELWWTGTRSRVGPQPAPPTPSQPD